jgi:hypothetical protein
LAVERESVRPTRATPVEAWKLLVFRGIGDGCRATERSAAGNPSFGTFSATA